MALLGNPWQGCLRGASPSDVPVCVTLRNTLDVPSGESQAPAGRDECPSSVESQYCLGVFTSRSPQKNIYFLFSLETLPAWCSLPGQELWGNAAASPPPTPVLGRKNEITPGCDAPPLEKMKQRPDVVLPLGKMKLHLAVVLLLWKIRNYTWL